MATCPECDAELEIDGDDLDEMEVGDPWDCDACGSHLRVSSIRPLEFDNDDEDADDEDDEEDDDDEEEVSDDDDVDDDDDAEEEGDDDEGGGDWEE
jgi:lysine biosynthesis protein LysW